MTPLATTLRAFPKRAGQIWIGALLLAFLILPGDLAASPLTDAISERLAAAVKTKRDNLAPLAPFYVERSFAPLWTGDPAALARAAIILDTFRTADTDGLDIEDYQPERLATLLAVSGPEGEAAAELELSRMLVAYANDLGTGQVDPNTVDSDVHLAPIRLTAPAVLNAAARTSDLPALLKSFAPATPQYYRLRNTLAAYRKFATTDDDPSVPDDTVLKPGTQAPAVALLRRRLTTLGDLVPQAATPGTDPTLYDPELYDGELEAAVRRFQARHGLAADGVAGKGTIAQANVKLAQRALTIRLNMERRRWMPVDLGRRYVFVNLADFELKVVQDERTVLTDQVVVGKPFTKTPVFSQPMTSIVINPYWNVPFSIATGEMLPRLRQDPGYLAKNQLTLLDPRSGQAVDPYKVDWQQVTARGFPYRIRQDTGAKNSLGRLKFDLPNQWNIYLHDTPARGPFTQTVRTFSHGCVRVEHPRELAVLLLEPDGWSRAALDQAIDSEAQQAVRLKKPVPVHITYLTAWTDKDGTVQFREDVYGRDATLATALEELHR